MSTLLLHYAVVVLEAYCEANPIAADPILGVVAGALGGDVLCTQIKGLIVDGTEGWVNVCQPARKNLLCSWWSFFSPLRVQEAMSHEGRLAIIVSARHRAAFVPRSLFMMLLLFRRPLCAHPEGGLGLLGRLGEDEVNMSGQSVF